MSKISIKKKIGTKYAPLLESLLALTSQDVDPAQTASVISMLNTLLAALKESRSTEEGEKTQYDADTTALIAAQASRLAELQELIGNASEALINVSGLIE